MTTVTDHTVDAAFCELAIRAAQTIQTHHSRGRCCPVCGTPAPCKLAILAERNLELTSVAVQLSTTDGSNSEG
jgi:hypothetical protein